ncbi:hypothetical protein D3C80_1684480 [compost metagenome]
MRQVEDRLRQLLEPDRTELMQQQGQNNRRRKRHDQIQQVQQQRVAHNRIKLAHGEQLFEVIESDPFAPAYSFKNAVVLKRNCCAVHRHVLENNEIGNRKKQQQV